MDGESESHVNRATNMTGNPDCRFSVESIRGAFPPLPLSSHLLDASRISHRLKRIRELGEIYSSLTLAPFPELHHLPLKLNFRIRNSPFASPYLAPALIRLLRRSTLSFDTDPLETRERERDIVIDKEFLLRSLSFRETTYFSNKLRPSSINYRKFIRARNFHPYSKRFV